MKLTVRKATPQDAAGIARVHVETWRDAYAGLMPAELLDNLSVSKRTKTWREMLAANRSNEYCLVAMADDTVAGWITVCKCRDGDAQSTWGELGGLYIHPQQQHRGLGKALMQEGLSLLTQEGYAQATLWVLTTNQAARDFYEKHGWRIEGSTKIDTRDGFDLRETRYITDL